MGYCCSNPWTTVFIWANGDVTHCCYSNIGPIGNINHMSLNEIWQGEKNRFVRENIRQGRYIAAGCEHFCRPFRWNRYYGTYADIGEIPEGLGRLNSIDTDHVSDHPLIIGLEVGGRCNLHCTHCLATCKERSLSPQQLESLKPYLEQASIVRVLGGEPMVNLEALEEVREISRLSPQPTVFLNTNGQIGLDKFSACLQDLESLHLKFSLEGIGADYESVRAGGKWETFRENLFQAKEMFAAKRQAGKDWRLYLNYCVMRSNFLRIPQVVQFAIEMDIPLVLNTINGLRHIQENVFFYSHLDFTEQEINGVVDAVDKLLQASDYPFCTELGQHLDYVIRAMHDKKLRLPYPVLERVLSVFKGSKTDRLLYLWYKLQVDPGSAWIYLSRKLRKRLVG